MGSGASKKREPVTSNLPYSPIFYNYNPPRSVVHPLALPRRMENGIIRYPDYGLGAVVIPLNPKIVIPKTEESASSDSDGEAEVWDGKAEFNYKKQRKSSADRAKARQKKRVQREKQRREAEKEAAKLAKLGIGPPPVNQKLSTCFFICCQVDEEGRPLATKKADKDEGNASVRKGFNFSNANAHTSAESPKRNIVGELLTAQPPEEDVVSNFHTEKRNVAIVDDDDDDHPAANMPVPRGGSLLLSKSRVGSTVTLKGRQRSARIIRVKAPKLYQIALFNDSTTHESHVEIVFCYTLGRIFVTSTTDKPPPGGTIADRADGEEGAASPPPGGASPPVEDGAAITRISSPTGKPGEEPSAEEAPAAPAPKELSSSSSSSSSKSKDKGKKNAPPPPPPGLKEKDDHAKKTEGSSEHVTAITQDGTSLSLEQTRRKVRPLPFVQIEEPPPMDEFKQSIATSRQQLDGALEDLDVPEIKMFRVLIVLPPASGVVVGRADFRAYTVATQTIPFQGKTSLTVMGRFVGQTRIQHAIEEANKLCGRSRTYRHFLANITTDGLRKKIHGLTSIDLYNKHNFENMSDDFDLGVPVVVASRPAGEDNGSADDALPPSPPLSPAAIW